MKNMKIDFWLKYNGKFSGYAYFYRWFLKNYLHIVTLEIALNFKYRRILIVVDVSSQLKRLCIIFKRPIDVSSFFTIIYCIIKVFWFSVIVFSRRFSKYYYGIICLIDCNGTLIVRKPYKK